MHQLSEAGQQAITAISQRHGFSVDAVMSMLDAVVRGNGSMAQFNHGEFAGSGQWMRGGMTMVSDMFNNYLKGRVDGLCSELSNLVANQPGLMQAGSFQSQSQGAPTPAVSWGGPSHETGGAPTAAGSLFAPPPPDWWGPNLRYPNSTGARTAHATPTSPRPAAWQWTWAARSPSTTRWTTRSAASHSNSRATAR